MRATKQSKMLCEEAMTDTVIADNVIVNNVIADNRYAIIIDVKGDTKPFIRPDIHGVFPELSRSPLQ